MYVFEIFILHLLQNLLNRCYLVGQFTATADLTDISLLSLTVNFTLDI